MHHCDHSGQRSELGCTARCTGKAPGTFESHFLFGQATSSAQVTMQSQNRKRAPAWTKWEVLDLISVWGEESMLSELCSKRRNAKTFQKISEAMRDRGYSRDATQCRVKLKELRQLYQKTKESNRCSRTEPQTCHFYAELHAILVGATTTTPPLSMDSGDGVLSTMPEDFVDGEDEEEEDKSWRRHTMASMEPAQLTAAVVSIVNTSCIILQYVQNLQKQASRRQQRDHDSDEDMDTDFSQSTGPGNLDIMVVTMNDITLLRLTQRDKEQMLLECHQSLGPFAAMLCSAMIPGYLLLAWRGKVSYHGGWNKAALPRNLLQRLLEYLQESFMEMSLEDFRSIPRHVNRLFQ
ncbi:Zinc finger and SCAN domain-containing protein 20 [Chelonia mydas]|uniref:Zinc finger and SCAN domain-containing protein 20 n=1 Tax=Chelonia mydas TaxID=8469 RepID=M7BRM3_CHEMY|nr:Zinc finger and SCAN domain-containing protein 20 [Chelonia mydas]